MPRRYLKATRAPVRIYPPTPLAIRTTPLFKKQTTPATLLATRPKNKIHKPTRQKTQICHAFIKPAPNSQPHAQTTHNARATLLRASHLRAPKTKRPALYSHREPTNPTPKPPKFIKHLPNFKEIY